MTYAGMFLLGIMIQVMITYFLWVSMQGVDRENPYYPLMKAIFVILLVSLVALIASYVAQATFMGWI